jgi:class 3 adenylate cyclase
MKQLLQPDDSHSFLKGLSYPHEMPADWPREYGRYYSAVKYTFPITIAIHATLIFFFLFTGVKELFYLNIASTVWWCSSFYFCRRKIRVALFSNVFNVIEMVLHAVLCTLYIGWDYGFAFYLYTLPLVIFLLPKRDTWMKAVFAVVTLAGFYICATVLKPLEPRYSLYIFKNTAFIINVSVPLMFITIISFYYAGYAEQSEKKIAEEKEKSDFLLENILPVSIIEKLQHEPGTIADEFSEVSVLFADVIDFTPATADRPPKEVVAFLNTLFSVFDEIVAMYTLEKIKTIGDAYMVTAGLPDPDPEHAHKIADCALDMLTASASLDFFGRKLQLRIGINSGPVVAGIIGKKKFSYDLWGDTVNTAARMEAQGVAGKIQTTHTVFDLLQGEFVFEKRGKIDVKGKGILETFFLTGRKKPGSNEISAQEKETEMVLSRKV